MKRLRTVLFWTHLLSGVIAGLAIFVMSATGAILAFKPQIQRYIERDVRTVPRPAGGRPRLGVQALLTALAAEKPDAQPASVTLEADPTSSAAVALGAAGTVYVDPYSGHLLGEGSTRTTAFFRAVENWHRWLAVSGDNRTAARAVNDASNAAFLLLAISGLYLWWPRKWLPQHVSAILWFRRARTARARDFNWHNVIGFWSAPILIVLAGTGVIMSYTWANNLLYRVAGSPVPAARGGAGAPAAAGAAGGQARAGAPGGSGAPEGAAARPGGRGRPGGADARPPVLPNLDAAWARAEQQVRTWHVVIMRLPNQSGMPVTFSIGDARDWNSFGRSTLTVDAETVEVVRWEPYANNSLGQRLRQWVRFSHTGELGRWPGQALAGAACLGVLFLVWTGLALACRRLFGWRVWRRSRRYAVTGLATPLGILLVLSTFAM